MKDLEDRTGIAERLRSRIRGKWLSDPKRDFNVICIYGKTNLVMEGCRRIVKYDPEGICVSGDYDVNVTGEALELREMGSGCVGVTGVIRKIEFI